MLSAPGAPPFSASQLVEEPGSLKVSIEVEDERLVWEKDKAGVGGNGNEERRAGDSISFFQVALLEGRAKSNLHRRVVF